MVWADTSFLHFETRETPMHVRSLMLLELLPADYPGDYYEEVKAMSGKQVHLAAVLMRKLAPMPFELAEPVCIDDDDIDLATTCAASGCAAPAPWSSCAS